MSLPEQKDVIQAVRQAGYRILSTEHTRPNRWVFTVQDGDATPMLVIVQARPLIGSSDVQDLDELVRVRRCTHGLLWAYDGNFSQAARRTCAELGSTNLTLCTVLPPVHH